MAAATPTGVDAVGSTASSLPTPQLPSLSEDVSLDFPEFDNRLLELVVPNVVHVMIDGRIVQSGGPELAQRLEADGYEWLTPTA